MASLLQKLGRAPQRSGAFNLDTWIEQIKFLGLGYFLPSGVGNTLAKPDEKIDPSFQGYADAGYKRNGVIFACIAARQLLFSEARFQFRQRSKGRPGDLFGTGELAILEHPWENATTGDLLTRAILDADLTGNFFAVRRGGAIRRLRPDWMTIVAGSRTGSEIDTEVLGYAYKPGGPASGEDPVVLLPEEVVHFAPLPDPLYRFRGMSWLSPILEEIQADSSAMTHKLMYFQNGAVPARVVTLDADIGPEAFEKWIDMFEDGHKGVLNAYKTLYLGGGADAKVVGNDLKQVNFAEVQGHGETRICAAARVPPIIVGLSEGLDSATYSNYGQARRAFADLTMRPLWRNIAGSLESIITVPGSSELWYDDRDIPFLQEDMKDAADIQQVQAISIRELINAGYEPDSVIAAVTSQDFSRLKHTGLVSVQLQEPGVQQNGPALNGSASKNGSPQVGAGRALAALMAPRDDKE